MCVFKLEGHKRLLLLFFTFILFLPIARGQAVFKAIQKAKTKKVSNWISQGEGKQDNLFISIANGSDTGQLDPFSYAVYCKKQGIVDLFLTHKDSFNAFESWANTALGVAVANNDTLLCKRLLALGANPNGIYALNKQKHTLLTLALLQNNPLMAKFLVANGANPLLLGGSIAPIHAAIFAQNLETITWLTNENKATIEQPCARGYTPLWYAILQEKMPLITFFEGKKVEFNHRSPEMETYFHAALATQNKEVVQWVKSRINLQEAVSPNPMSPLVHLVVKYADLELFTEAINAGMEVYDMDKFSRTAIFALLETTQHRKKLAEILLLEYQLDLMVMDAFGKTVKQYAAERKDKELLKILNSINTQ